MSREVQIQTIEHTTTVQIDNPSHFIESDSDSDSKGEDNIYTVHKGLIRYAQRVAEIINSPEQNDGKIRTMIKQVTKELNLHEINGTSYSQGANSEPFRANPTQNHANNVNISKVQIENGNSLDEYLDELQSPDRRKSANEQHIRQQIVKSYQQQIAKLKEDHKKAIDSMSQTHKTEIETLNSVNTELKRKQVQLQDQIQSLKVEKVESRDFVIEHEKNIRLNEQLHTKNEIIVDQSNRLIDLGEQINRFNSRFHDLQAERQELKDNIANLQATYAGNQTNTSNMEQQNRQLLARLAAKEAAVIQLQQRVQSLLNEVQIKDYQNQQMVKSLQRSNEEISKLNREKSELQHQITQNNDKSAQQELLNRIQALQSQKDQILAQKTLLMNEIKELREFQANHLQNGRNNEEEVARLNRQVNELRTELTRPLTPNRLYHQINTYYNTLQLALKRQFKTNMSILIGGLR